mmetsp:Transcript_8389/g.23638  ORF Transcript_8389/g.23638 Transcript_8389/m.23638 type:complete len:810 (-) Transcript_8389:66-2495(-)
MPASAIEEPLELQVKHALELIAQVSSSTEERLAAIEAKQLCDETKTSGLQYAFDEMKACFGDLAANGDIYRASSRRAAAEGDEEMLAQMRASIERLESQSNLALNTLAMERDTQAATQLRFESLEARIAELPAAPPARDEHQEAISGVHASIAHLENQCNLALAGVSSHKERHTSMQRQFEDMQAQFAELPRDAVPGATAHEQHTTHLVGMQELEASLIQRLEALQAQLEQHQGTPVVMRHDFDGALEEYNRSLADLHGRCDALAQSQGGPRQPEPDGEDVTLALQQLRQHIQAEHDERIGFAQEITMELQQLREHAQSGIQPGQGVRAAPGEDYVALLQQLSADIQTERGERLNSAEALGVWQRRMEENLVKASVETLDTLRMEVGTLHESARGLNQDAGAATEMESSAAPAEIVRMIEAEREARAEIASIVEAERGARAELASIVGAERGARVELARTIEMEQGARVQDLQLEREARDLQVSDLNAALRELAQRMESNAQQEPASNDESPRWGKNVESLLLTQREEMEQKLTELLTVTVREQIAQAMYEGGAGAGAGRTSCITADLAMECREHAKEIAALQKLVDSKANASNQAIATFSCELRNEFDVLRQTMAVMTEQVGALGQQTGAPDPASSPDDSRMTLNSMKLEFGSLRAELARQSTDIQHYHREMVGFVQDGQPCLNYKVTQDITESRAVLDSMKQCVASIQAEVATQCSEIDKFHGDVEALISKEVGETRQLIKEELQRDVDAEREDRLRSERELWSSLVAMAPQDAKALGSAAASPRQTSGGSAKGEQDAGFFTRFFTG